jgi:hypothetical protein
MSIGSITTCVDKGGCGEKEVKKRTVKNTYESSSASIRDQSSVNEREREIAAKKKRNGSNNIYIYTHKYEERETHKKKRRLTPSST